MIQPKSFFKHRIDKFLLLLIFFALLLSSLFFYLQKIDGDIKHYDEYHHKLEKMISLDHQLDNFFLKSYRYIDFDEIAHISKEFEENLAFLYKSDIDNEFGQHIYNDIENIKSAYKEKLYFLERFKTLNSRVTNSIHYLYDLRKTLDKIDREDSKKEELLDQIFFTIGQSLMDIPFKKTKLIASLEEIRSYGEKHNIYTYFYQQSKQFLADMEAMKKNFTANKKVKLNDAIYHVMGHLDESYVVNRNQHKVITISFFLLGFLILIILMFNYQKVRRSTRELLAFRYAIENSDNSIMITDRDRKIEYVNDAFEEHTGYAKYEVLGKNPNILKSDLMNDTFYKNMNEVLDRSEKWQGELINKRKDGTLLYEKASIVPIILEDELVQYLAIKLDITDYIEQQQRLQQSSAVYEMMGDGIIVTDKDKKILSANPAFVDMFGYKEKELLGEEPRIIHALKEDTVFYENMWNKLLTKNRWSGKVHNKTKYGKLLPIWLTITIVRDKSGGIQNFIAIYTNLEEIIEMEAKANFLAYHDSLTQLPNRAHFEREIIDVFELAKINKEKVAILFIDLDRFKVINDTLGHHIGDEMLVKLSERIKKVLEKNDLFARIGGDEFVVILNPVKEKKDAGTTAEKILSIIRKPIRVQNYCLNTTASIGIAMYPADGEDKSSIVKHADSAMYAAKDSGKDTYRYYTAQLSLNVEKRLYLELELMHALEKEEFLLYYQPQYHLKSGKIIGAEALLRWNNPNLGWVSPDDFIPVSEETGSIVEIGYFVFEEACREYMRWKENGFDIERIAINISSVQFQQENMFESFMKIIEKVGISPHNIEIEITESFLMEDSMSNIMVLEELRHIGCQISIDDFGTGYSSMSYMKSLPLDTIKIDRSFVMDLPDDLHDVEVSKAIIALSKSLGYQVVAEGIETLEQEKFLLEHHCDVGQGYYFGKPMDKETFVAFVKEKRE